MVKSTKKTVSKPAASKTATAVRKERPSRLPESQPEETPLFFTPGELNVFRVFYRYRMTVGHMLCFNGPDFTTHRTSLTSLVGKGALLAERFAGAYCLTTMGFHAMRASVEVD